MPNDFSFFRKKELPPYEASAVAQAGKAELMTPQQRRSAFWIAGQTDVGCVRDHNEDSFLTFSTEFQQGDRRSYIGIFVVADGMGGHQQGEKASWLAARIVANNLLQTFVLPTINGDDNSTPMYETMTAAVQMAHAQIQETLPGAGTTLTAAVIVDDSLAVAHVGDSRVYVQHSGELKQITQDHSLVQRLVEIGHLTVEEAAHDPRRNVLHRALGQAEALEVDFQFRAFEPGSRLLVCSDGLWGQISPEDIGSVLSTNTDPNVACSDLIRLANAAGGPDNITAILVYSQPS